MSLLSKNIRMITERVEQLGPVPIETVPLWEALLEVRSGSQQAVSRFMEDSLVSEKTLREAQADMLATAVQAVRMMEALERLADLEAGRPVRHSQEGEDA